MICLALIKLSRSKEVISKVLFGVKRIIIFKIAFTGVNRLTVLISEVRGYGFDTHRVTLSKQSDNVYL